MRIVRLSIDGFGRFRDTDFGPLDAPITVFHGPNEAGKSTLLAFLRTMLFGFPARKREAHYPPLDGGVHGGRLWLRDESGCELELWRNETQRGTATALTTPDGQRDETGALLNAALGHVRRETYESVFAFSLTELQQFSSLDVGEAAAQIYSAGMGAAKLPRAQRTIGDLRDAIYKPRGSTQAISVALTRLDQVEKQLRDASRDAEQFADLSQRKATIEDERRAVEQTIRELAGEQRRAEALRAAWDAWVELEMARDELAGIAAIEGFPADGQSRLDQLVSRREAAGRALRETEEQLRSTREDMDVPAGVLSVLEHEGAIEALQRGRQAFAGSVADAPKRRAELQNEVERLQEVLRGLGPGWDESRVEQFDTSTEVRATVDRWRGELERADSDVRTASDRAERARDAHDGARARLLSLQQELEALPAPSYRREQVDDLRAQVVRTKTRLGQYRQAEGEVESLRREAAAQQPAGQRGAGSNRFIPFAVAMAILGLVAVAVGVILGGGAVWLGTAAGVALVVAAAGGVFAFRETIPSQVAAITGRVRPAEERLAAMQRALGETAASFGVAGIDEETLDRLEISLLRADEGVRTYDELRKRVEEASSGEQRLAAALADATGKEQASQERRAAALAGWQGWLAQRGLPGALTPQSADGELARIEAARTQVRTVENVRRRLDAIYRDIREFGERVGVAAELNGLARPSDDPEAVARTADALVEALQRARDARAKRAATARELQRRERSVASAREEVERAGDEVARLLASGGTESEDEFRERWDEQMRRRALVEDARNAETRLRKIVGPAMVDEVQEALRATDKAALDTRVAEVGEEIDRTSGRLQELAQESGEVAAELKRLTSDEQTSILRAEREMLRAKIAGEARRWATLTVAQSMLLEAQERYQRERQPGVIKSADAVFQAITGGRYHNLMSPLGDAKERQLTVTDRDGSPKKIEQLSRGTQEALYLALRFGLIRQFGEQACRLPVIIDEVLVNLDPERQERTAAEFARLAETNQVLVFTCHPGMVDVFRKAEPRTQVIEISA